jgi:hypothetical protein
VLLRPVIECWIDCCYVLYCKIDAVMQLTSLGLRERVKVLDVWLGDSQGWLAPLFAEFAEVVEAGQSAGLLGEIRPKLPLPERLKAAIACRGSAPSYMDVYDFLYRGISSMDIHTFFVLERHAIQQADDELTVTVTPNELLDATVMTAIAVRLLCGAAIDAFELVGAEVTELTNLTRELDREVRQRAAEITAKHASDPAPEVEAILEMLNSRGLHESDEEAETAD